MPASLKHSFQWQFPVLGKSGPERSQLLQFNLDGEKKGAGECVASGSLLLIKEYLFPRKVIYSSLWRATFSSDPPRHSSLSIVCLSSWLCFKIPFFHYNHYRFIYTWLYENCIFSFLTYTFKYILYYVFFLKMIHTDFYAWGYVLPFQVSFGCFTDVTALDLKIRNQGRTNDSSSIT